MESLSYGGVETVLFVNPPDEQMLARYPHVRAFGIAGSSRAMTPEEMDAQLPSVFQALGRHQPPIVHYKCCSTFDSSPQIGNIGRAIEIGRRVFDSPRCPLVVGAPVLQRFCVFGNLFARSGLDSVPYRLDRHPTMKCHPVTPMDEADLRVHLACQTELPIELVDVLSLDDPKSDCLEPIRDHNGIVLFDTLRDVHLHRIGETIWQLQQQQGGTLFTAGSSGVDYALVDYWRSAGQLDAKPWSQYGQPIDQTIVFSGSCAPVTDRQIAWAVAHGFEQIALETSILSDPSCRDIEIDRVVGSALELMRQGRSVIVHTSRGPNDSRIASTSANADEIGGALAEALSRTLREHSLTRVGVTGGDTSGHVARGIGIEALEMVGPMAPGSPLCVARSSNATIDGLEITFKGGQVGHDDFFDTLLRGRSGDC